MNTGFARSEKPRRGQVGFNEPAFFILETTAGNFDVSADLDYRLLGLNNENMILNKMTTAKMTAPKRIAFIKAGFMMGFEVPI